MLVFEYDKDSAKTRIRHFEFDTTSTKDGDVITLSGEALLDDVLDFTKFQVEITENRIHVKDIQNIVSLFDGFISLLEELDPDTVIFRSANSETFTASEMIDLILQGDQLGAEFVSDLLRVSRDYLKRLAKKPSKE